MSEPMHFLAAAGWQLKTTGWPWWLVVLIGALAVWVLVRLHRRELAPLGAAQRRRLLLFRGCATALLVLFLLEPVLARRSSEKVLPLVAVLVDQSGSMSVKDEPMAPGAKLGEAVGLGLLPAGARASKTNEAEQAAADEALLASGGPDSPARRALATVSSLSRYERAVRLAQRVLPVLEKHARVQVFGLDTALRSLDLGHPAGLLPNGATDFEMPLSNLARNWAQQYVGGAFFITDGRQTVGADPLPVIRSLHARGALVSGLLVGDPRQPPDAVVAEVSGSSEVFLGENVPLSVRYRISGAPELDFDLVLTQEGRELERRTVRGNGQWQYQHFTFAATNLGINLYQARLELAREQTADLLLPPSGSVGLEVWKNVAGQNVSDLVNNPAFAKAPSMTTTLDRLQYSHRGDQYGARVRGFLIPPQTGDYVFSIASDDGSELWLSPGENPKDKTRIAFVSGFVPEGKWEAESSQKSRPFTLKARKPYYFEVLHKQGGGEDHLGVGWRLPDGTLERPIPGSRLAPYDAHVLATIEERKQKNTHARTNEWREASLSNNAGEMPVVVNQDPIRVLLVDSTPRWESRYLAAMFERDRRVALTRRYHSIILQDSNLHLLPQSQSEWDSYDMVCLGDLDGNELPPEQQTMIARFVARRGGFLVCLAGPRGLPSAFSLGTLAGVLPVRVAAPSSRNSEPVTVALTETGMDHPVMQILNDPSYNQKLWPLLPPLQWIADSVVPKAGATVLLVARNPGKTPVVATERYGAGRVFWMGTEESWRWRDRLGERVHQTFWLQVMRWGLAGRLRGKDPRLQVGLDRYLAGPDEAAELKARVSGLKGEAVPDPPMAKLEEIGDNGAVIQTATRLMAMEPMPEAAGLWRQALTGLPEGHWRITVTNASPELQGLAETRELIVRHQTRVEGLDLSADFGELARMASAGGFRAGRAEDTGAVAEDFASKLKPRLQERRETIRLWNGYLAIGLAVGLLSAEWILRKREGLP